jgi:hypothetical protein
MVDYPESKNESANHQSIVICTFVVGIPDNKHWVDKGESIVVPSETFHDE